MTKLLTISAIAALTASSFASAKDVTFKPVDQTLETNLCVIAASQGYDMAQQTAKQFDGYNKIQFNATVCNGIKISRFARKYQQQEQIEPVVKNVVYRFKTVDASEESRICALAAEKGLDQAISLAGKEVKGIICNGRDISYFARKYHNS